MPAGCVTASQQKAAQRQAHTGDGRSCLFIARGHSPIPNHIISTGPYPLCRHATRQAAGRGHNHSAFRTAKQDMPGRRADKEAPLHNRAQAAGHARHHGGAADGGCNIRGLLTGHGPVIENPSERIEQARRHRLQRLQQVVSAVRSGIPADAEALVEAVYNDVRPELHDGAVRSVNAQLRYAFDEGILQENR